MIITDLLQAEMGYLNSLVLAVSFFFLFCIAVYMCSYLVSYLFPEYQRLDVTFNKSVLSSSGVCIESHSEFEG